jgi:hypothetical protein
MGLFGGGDYKVTRPGMFGPVTVESYLSKKGAHSKAQQLSLDGTKYFVETLAGEHIATYKNGR